MSAVDSQAMNNFPGLLEEGGAPPAKRARLEPELGVPMNFMGAMPGVTNMPGITNMAGLTNMPCMSSMPSMPSMPSAPSMPMMNNPGMMQFMAPNMAAMNASIPMGAQSMIGMTSPCMAQGNMPCNGMPGGRPPPPSASPRPKVAAKVRDNRSPAEIKDELWKLGIDTRGVVATRDMLLKLHETEAFVRRAEATKKLSRYPEQKLLSCFTEGLAPGSEVLLGAKMKPTFSLFQFFSFVLQGISS